MDVRYSGSAESSSERLLRRSFYFEDYAENEKSIMEIYEEHGIQTGDISPEQSMNWKNLTINFSTLFFELIEQNKR